MAAVVLEFARAQARFCSLVVLHGSLATAYFLPVTRLIRKFLTKQHLKAYRGLLFSPKTGVLPESTTYDNPRKGSP